MVLQKIISFTKRFEQPEHPLLGPNISGFHMIGMWHTASKFRANLFKIIYLSCIFFIMSQFYDLYEKIRDKESLNKILSNFSLSAPSATCWFKIFTFVLYNESWFKLVNSMSREELTEIGRNNPKIRKIMKNYINYANFLTYSYCTMLFVTFLMLVTTPLWKYLSSSFYRQNIEAGIEPYPQILNSWFPFDNLKMPGYVYASGFHVFISLQGAVIIALYDALAVTVMTFLKGQLRILKYRCSDIFEGNDRSQYMARIMECHRHHNLILEQHRLFNSILSPVMFQYVLICSATICSSVIQLTLGESSTFEKVWVVQFSMGQFFQLLLYCWHANEIIIESNQVDRGIFAGEWWKADVRMRQYIIMLAGKLNQALVLQAGPFASLSVPTFISIIQGSYSFFTLISQMNESK